MPALRHIYFLLIFMLIATLAIRLFIPISLWIPIVLMAALLGVLAYGSFDIQADFFTKAYHQPTSSRQEIALTFDDGPTKQTPEILEILKEFDALATFFCIGKSIEQYPEILKKTIAEGHSIGNHSYSHNAAFPFFSRKRISKELKTTSVLISKYTGNPVELFRPPFGVTNPGIVKAAKARNLKIVGWNLRSFDGSARSSEQILRRILPRIEAGTVLLLHDTRPDAGLILREVLKQVQQKNLKPVTVSQLFDLNETA